MKKIIRNPKGNASSLRHDSEAMRAAAIAGSADSSSRLKLRWAEEKEKMTKIAAAASAAVPQGQKHPNARIYVIYPPNGLPPIRGVKNLSLWIRENYDLLLYTCKPSSVHVGMTGKHGWRGWFAEVESRH